VNTAFNRRIPVAITEPHIPEDKCRHRKKEADHWKATENPEVVGDQSFRILVGNDPAGCIAFVRIGDPDAGVLREIADAADRVLYDANPFSPAVVAA
jgi:hypothetical protein